MRLMPKTDRLEVLDADDFTNLSSVKNFFHQLGVLRIAHDMTNCQHHTSHPHGLDDTTTIGFVWTHRFLEQQVIPKSCKGNRGVTMKCVWCGDDDAIGKFGTCQPSVPIVCDVFRCNLVCLHQLIAVEIPRFCHTNNLELIWMIQGITCVNCTSRTRPNHGKSDWCSSRIHESTTTLVR